MLCLVPESKPVTSVLQNGMYTRAGTLALCVLGAIALFVVNAFAQNPPNIGAMPVFQAETAKDAQQDEHMAGIDARVVQIQNESAATLARAEETQKIQNAFIQDNHDRLIRDESIVYGVFSAVGILQAAGLITKFKTRSSFTS